MHAPISYNDPDCLRKAAEESNYESSAKPTSFWPTSNTDTNEVR